MILFVFSAKSCVCVIDCCQFLKLKTTSEVKAAMQWSQDKVWLNIGLLIVFLLSTGLYWETPGSFEL